MNDKQAHLNMIQDVINRLSNNSFLLKGWSVVLVSGLFALAAAETNRLFLYLSYFPSISLWFLDGYFLWQERLFRALYDQVRKKSIRDVDFSMDTSIVRSRVDPWLASVFSKTILAFHGTVIAAIIIVMISLTLVSKGV
jgi:hypothetical protein